MEAPSSQLKAPLRVLHVVPSYLPATRYGGPIYSVHALCSALARRGHDVHVFTTNVDGPGVSDVRVGRPVEIDGVMVSYFSTGLGRRLFRSPTMAKALEVEVKKFDVLHLHSVFLWPTSAAAAVARRYGIPYVLAPRGMLVSDLIRRKSRYLKTTWIAVFERRNLAGAAAVHVTAELEAAELTKCGFRARRVAIIPNGIDLPVSGPSPHGSVVVPRPAVLSLGRINWKKGLDRLVCAMADVSDAQLLIVGDDDEGFRAQLEALALQAGVAHRTHFLGPLHGPEKWTLMSNADVFVLASHSENFGNAALEAMALGVPVIVTPGVGLAEAVARNNAGLVVAGDPASIASALNELLGESERRKIMGQAGRKMAFEEYSWDLVARKTETLYSEITLNQSPVPADWEATDE